MYRRVFHSVLSNASVIARVQTLAFLFELSRSKVYMTLSSSLRWDIRSSSNSKPLFCDHIANRETHKGACNAIKVCKRVLIREKSNLRSYPGDDVMTLPRLFEEHLGHFWGIFKTRDYLYANALRCCRFFFEKSQISPRWKRRWNM